MKTLSIFVFVAICSIAAAQDSIFCSPDSGEYCLLDNPGRAIPYDCDHVPPFCPQFAMPGGAICEATNPTTGELLRTQSRKNTCLAEHKIVDRICAKQENPQDFTLSCHQGG